MGGKPYDNLRFVCTLQSQEIERESDSCDEDGICDDVGDYDTAQTEVCAYSHT